MKNCKVILVYWVNQCEINWNQSGNPINVLNYLSRVLTKSDFVSLALSINDVFFTFLKFVQAYSTPDQGDADA